MNVKEMIQKIEDAANAAVKTPVDASDLKVGDVIRQGDVYIARLPDGAHIGKPHKAELALKLALGETAGSRHILEGDFQAYDRDEKSPMPEACKASSVTPLWSPAFKVGKGGATITHPEHAHVVNLVPGCSYQAWQQMDPRTRQRVQD